MTKNDKKKEEGIESIIKKDYKNIKELFESNITVSIGDIDVKDADNYEIELYHEIIDDLLQTPYTTKGAVLKLYKECELSLQEFGDVIHAIAEYGIQPHSMKTLIQAGIPIKYLSDLMATYRDENFEAIFFQKQDLEPLRKDKKDNVNRITYYIANAGECISISDIAYLYKLTNEGTPIQIKLAIYEIRRILDEEDYPKGIGTALKRMKELQETDDRFSDASLELLTKAAINRLYNHKNDNFQ